MTKRLSKYLKRLLLVCIAAAVPAQTAQAQLMEKLACITGPRDEQVRLTVLTVKGRPMEFAYYSRWGTRVCSIHGRRGDAYTKWADEPPSANATAGRAVVTLLEGTAELEYKPGIVKLTLDTVDRMRFCGMEGELNGTIEVFKAKGECTFKGVFELEAPADYVAIRPVTPQPEVTKPAAKKAPAKAAPKRTPAKRAK